jgi:hypothetical protein
MIGLKVALFKAKAESHYMWTDVLHIAVSNLFEARNMKTPLKVVLSDLWMSPTE